MKGIVFNLLEQLVRTSYGEDEWDDLLDRAASDGVYTAIGSYDDADFVRLLRAAPDSIGADLAERLRWFGEHAMPLLAQHYPAFFADHTTTLSFLLTLNDIIHPEVRKLYPGADVPTFDVAVDPARPTRLVLGYRSRRGLCHLADGFVRGAAHHFGERVDVTQPTCVHAGADHCVILCDFSGRPDG